MQFNRQLLVDSQDQTSDETVLQIDLPNKGCLSGIDLKLGADNTTETYGSSKHSILEIPKKIEVVVNGDIRLFSMNAQELFQWYWIKNGKPPYHEFNTRPSETAEVMFPIRFGRWLGDPSYGLDLSAFDNAQLVIDYHLDPIATSTTLATDGYLTGTFNVNALAHITPPSKPASFRGCISTRQYYNYTTVASEVKRMALPTQYPILSAGVYLFRSAISMNALVTKASLSLDNDAFIPIRGRWYDHVRAQAENITDDSLRFLERVTSTSHVDLLGHNIRNVQLKPLIANAVPSASVFAYLPSFAIAGGLLTWGVGHDLTAASHSAGAVTATAMADGTPIDVMSHVLPDRMIRWDFTDDDGISGAIVPGQYSKAEAVIEMYTTGSATCSLIVEELRPNRGS
jgi:hypothetical protein